MKRQRTPVPRVKASARALDYAAINAALEKHLGLALTESTLETIKRSVGGGEFEKIKEILAFTSNQDAWLQANNVSAAADTVSGRLSQTYPFLSELAVFRLISQATYGWR
jgi:hypothetical protein